jgi:SAM-dependent methyltransferase
VTDYSGTENLEVMEEAVNYNRYLLECVDRWLVDGRWIDFGAGTGTFARALVQRGRCVFGVEPDPILRARMNDAGLTAVADSAALFGREFDGIYSMNVMEHIEDDKAALTTALVAVKPGGKVLLYVPAFMVLFGEMDRRVGHVRRYTRRELIRLAEDAGVEVAECKYVDSIGFFAALLMRIAGRPRSGEIGRGSVRFYDRWIFPLSLALDKVMSRFFGKNLILLGTKAGVY